MTQTTDPRSDHGRAPWATPAQTHEQAPSAPGAPSATQAPDTTQPIATPGAWPPPSGAPAAAPSGPAAETASWGQDRTAPLFGGPQPGATPQGGQHDAGHGAPPPPPPSSFRREPRRPGWPGVVAVGAGAAVLSSLLTAGVVTALDNSSPVTATTSSSRSGTAVSPPVSSGNVAAPNWGDVAKAVEPSVVSVQVAAGQSSGEGSGIVLDAQGRVLTNNHVIADAANGGQIQVVLSDGRTYDATIIGRDASTDLAVIKLTDPPSDLTPATLGDSSTVGVGDAVMALGNPLGLSDTVTTGIVSAVDRPVTTTSAAGQAGAGGEAVVTNAIQTDAAVNPGNSGGALVDSRGRVIGITSSIASLGASMGGQAGSIGLGFAIPVNVAKDVADQLVKSGTADHAFLGVSLGEGTVSADGGKRRAATLQSVTAGGPAADAGLRTGDAVVAIDGEPVSGADSLVAQIRERRPGTAVELTVVRDGSSRTVSVTLGTRPANP